MDLRRWVKPVRGPIHDPSIKLIAEMEFISKQHQQLEERRTAQKRQREKELEESLEQPPIVEKEIVVEPCKKRGRYNQYSEEFRSDIVVWAKKFGVSSACSRFAAHNVGKGVPGRTGGFFFVLFIQ